MSGDYLFAYDRDTCAESAGGLAAPGFFACMTALGYFQIDPQTGAPIDPTETGGPAATVASSAAR